MKNCCEFKEEGWGSVKGAIYVYHVNGAELGAILYSKEDKEIVFDCEWAEFSIHALSEILEYMKKNKNKIIKSSR